MGHDKFQVSSSKRGGDRHKRILEREVKRRRHDAAQALLDLQKNLVMENTEVNIPEPRNEEVEEINEKKKSVEVQTVVTKDYISALQAEMQRLTMENMDLKDKLGHFTVTADSFKGNDDKVKYFTGLPNYLMLMAIFNFISKSIPQTDRCLLTKFQKMMMVLMRLRLNVPLTLLGHWFSVSPTTASRIYETIVNIMYAKMKCLIRWPEREQLKKTMPMDFRKHFKTNVALIIDCFEVFIERPSNLQGRALTFSNYKHSNTVKYLIGIIPQGVICYISEGWGGRTSDKYLTEHCNILDKLLPGDVVLADRGFDIADSVGAVCAQLYIPAFTKGKSQLSALEVETTRKIANVRIHVERVIGNLKQKYTFFDSTMPVDHLMSAPGDIPILDKEIVICCALVNLNDSVVPIN